MSTENFNSTALKERLEEQECKIDFYKEGIEMLQDQYNLGEMIQQPEAHLFFPDLEDNYLLNTIKNKEEITKAHILRTDVDKLDDFIFSCLYTIGIMEGTGSLIEDGSDDSLEYREWLMEKINDDDWFLQIGMCGAHYLISGCVPSMDLLERLAPQTEDREVNQMTCNLVIEYYHDLVSRYKFHKNRLKEQMEKRLADQRKWKEETGFNF